MSGFGARLREARESHGITLEQVEAETKIRKLYVEALENENFSILPPQVYAIGFVRRYAKMLNLDGDALSKEFKQLAYPEVIEEFVQEKPVKEKRKLSLPKLPYKNIALAAVFLLLAIWAGNLFADYLGNRVQNNEPKTPVKVGDKNPPQVVQPGKSETDQIKLQIKVKPDMQCWIRVLADGQNKLEAILDGGQEQTFTAEQSIYIKLGNAGAVDIIVDDKPIDPLGEIGQVAEKEFTKSDKN
ncbi:MAG: hypothetical protein H6Q64_541 [Firmicutes bacterium]|nr:hypothetical protein [Bacillota bacterium]